MPNSSPAAKPRAAGFRAAPVRWLLRRAAWLLVAIWTVLLITWLTLHWGILPRIHEWRGTIEQRASRVLGVPVRIGAIHARSAGWVPAVELRDVELLGADGRPALALPRVAAAISARSLLSLELRFEQLLVEGAALDVRRAANGRILVAGLALDGGGDDGTLADWFFRQREFVVRGGTVRWIDGQRAAAPLALHDVQLVLRNGLRQHDLRLDATPDPAWGERFRIVGRFTQPLLARGGDWRRWQGSAYLELPYADLRELGQHVTLPFELTEGDGALRAWIDVAEGRPRGGTVDVALRAVSLRLGADTEPLVVQQLAGRVVVERAADGASFAVQRLALVTGEGVRWPEGNLVLRLRQPEGRAIEGGEFSADRIDLDLISKLAERLPVGDAVRRLLAELTPRGTMRALRARWDGPVDAPRRYHLQGHVSGLALAARPASQPHEVGRPGLRNADVQLDARESGGEARLTLVDGSVTLPGVFEEADLPLARLAAQLRWTIEPGPGGAAPAITVGARDVQFANADAEGSFDVQWKTGPGSGVAKGGRFPGRLELDGRIGRAAALRVPRYLPLQIGATRRYLARAIGAGNVTGATFRVRGDLWNFPFFGAATPRDGEFRIVARAEDMRFAYVPDVAPGGDESAFVSPWPPLTQMSGELVIDREALQIRDARARILGVDLRAVNGGIATMHAHPVLRLAGSGRGPLAEMLRFVDRTPVAQWTAGALHEASAGGDAELQLALALPLGALDSTTVRGSVVLDGNDLRFSPDTPLLAAARGRVEFTERGFSVGDAAARVLGGELRFDGGTRPDGGVRFSGRGSATADALRTQTVWPPLARAAPLLRGETNYALTLDLVRGHAEFELSSALDGVAIDLPAPLGKAPDAPLPLHVEVRYPPDEQHAERPPRQLVRVDLGDVLHARFLNELDAASVRVLRGGIGVFEPPPWPPDGVTAAVTVPRLNVDEWRAALLASAGELAATADAGTGFAPSRIALRAQELVAASRRLTAVTAGISRAGAGWRATLDAEQLEGFVEYQPERADSPGRVQARLARLVLPKEEHEQVESLLEADPKTVPALDIVVDDFVLRGKKLGRLEIEAVNRERAAGSAHEWQLEKLDLTMPEARFSATGRWAAHPEAEVARGGRRAEMDFKLAVADGGALLDRLAKGHAIRGGKGELSGRVAWVGSPFAPDYPSMTGQIAVAIESGQFLKADPGAARLLGVLSLQSLPRRLALDFRDVFQEGFAFDSITGDVTIAQGVAHTNNLRMRGLQAAVLMEGNADLAHESADLRVVVVPEIDAGTASLAYAAINPAIGLGTFLAQLLLRRPLIAANTREFHVFGPWDDPKVDRIEPREQATPPSAAGDATAPQTSPGATR